MTADGDDVLARIPAHTHDGITYTPVYSLAEIPSNATGSYYLLQDAKMSGAVTVGANNTVNVCLNGHKSEPIYFKNSGTLNITDCQAWHRIPRLHHRLFLQLRRHLQHRECLRQYSQPDQCDREGENRQHLYLGYRCHRQHQRLRIL